MDSLYFKIRPCISIRHVRPSVCSPFLDARRRLFLIALARIMHSIHGQICHPFTWEWVSERASVRTIERSRGSARGREQCRASEGANGTSKQISKCPVRFHNLPTYCPLVRPSTTLRIERVWNWRVEYCAICSPARFSAHSALSFAFSTLLVASALRCAHSLATLNHTLAPELMGKG